MVARVGLLLHYYDINDDDEAADSVLASPAAEQIMNGYNPTPAITVLILTLDKINLLHTYWLNDFIVSYTTKKNSFFF